MHPAIIMIVISFIYVFFVGFVYRELTKELGDSKSFLKKNLMLSLASAFVITIALRLIGGFDNILIGGIVLFITSIIYINLFVPMVMQMEQKDIEMEKSLIQQFVISLLFVLLYVVLYFVLKDTFI